MSTAPPCPTVTLALFSYNQQDFIEEAVRSVLAQDCAPMEIIVSDDCSSDDTFGRARAVVESYSGPHRVQARRNETNLGLIPHVNLVMELASGEIVVAAAGDDVSLPHRVRALLDARMRGDGKAVLFFSNAIVVDRDGKHRGPYLGNVDRRRWELRSMAQRGAAGNLGVTSSWDRRIFSVFGPIPEGVMAEDTVIAFRAALLGGIQYIEEPLVHYRLHGNNISLNSVERVQDGRHLLQLLRRGAAGNVATSESNMRDLIRAHELGFYTASELNELSGLIARHVAELRSEADMFDMGRLGRATIIVRHLALGTRPRLVARWILWFMLPDLYVRQLKVLRSYRVWRAHRNLEGVTHLS